MAVTLATPGWLLLLPLIWLWIARARRQPAGGALLVLPDFDGLTQASRRPGLESWLTAAALSLLVLALARPQSEGALVPRAPPARDIVLLVDSSPSMAVADFTLDGISVTRLEAIKRSISTLLAARPHDRFALVVFGDHAATLVPMTSDHRLVEAQLRRLTPDALGRGTALGEALGLALRQVESREGPRPLLLLLSDGDNTAGELTPAEALALARQRGLAFYTVAVGGDGKPTEGPSLDQLAILTGGQHFAAADAAALEGVVREVDRAETGVPPPALRVQREWYPLPLVVAALLLALARRRAGGGAG